MIAVLRDSGAWARLAPALEAWCAADETRCATLMQALDACPPRAPLRFACLCHGLSRSQIQAQCRRWRVDTESRELADMVAREWPTLRRGSELAPDEASALLERSDAWRRPGRLRTGLSVVRALASTSPDPAAVQRQCDRIERALQSALQVSVDSLPAEARATPGPALGRALRDARQQAIAQALAA
jgi:hypothetical protein